MVEHAVHLIFEPTVVKLRNNPKLYLVDAYLDYAVISKEELSALEDIIPSFAKTVIERHSPELQLAFVGANVKDGWFTDKWEHYARSFKACYDVSFDIYEAWLRVCLLGRIVAGPGGYPNFIYSTQDEIQLEQDENMLGGVSGAKSSKTPLYR